MGSGLLFDIPLAELCQFFREVLHVDILHPWQVRKTVLAHPNATVLDLVASANVLSRLAVFRNGYATRWMRELSPEWSGTSRGVS